MEFLNAALIGGVVLGGVPVLIHLLNRRRYRETIWAAMDFLREAVRRHAARLRLEDVLLLVLRVLAVALIALALARPTLTGRWGGFLGLARGTSTAAIIVLDNSYSMGAVQGETTLFGRARDLARRIIDTLPRGGGSSAALLLVNDRVEPVVGRLSHDLPAVDRALLRAACSDGGTDFTAALEVVRDTLLPQAKALRTEVHLLTDGQRRPWEQGGKRLADLLAQVADRAALYVETFPPATADNLAVTAVGIPGLAGADRTTQDILPSIHTACTIQAAVRNFGGAARESVPVDLWLDGQMVDRRVIARVEPGAEERAVFRLHIPGAGSHRVRTELAPGPNDRLPADDTRFLSLFVYDHVRVLVVDGDPRSGPFESESDYLRLALSPVDLDAPRSPFLITTDVRTLEELEGVQLADYAVVVLANVAGVSQALAGRLARFVANGGGLMVFVGDQVNVQDYNDVLWAGGTGLLPARLTGLVGDPEDKSRWLNLLTGDLRHYLVSHYEPTDPTLSRVRVHAALGAEVAAAPPSSAPPPASQSGAGAPPSAPPVAQAVLRYTNGLPFVVTRPAGLGHVILVTTSADTDWTNLPATHALVPLMQRSVNYLVFGQHAPERVNLMRGQPLVYHLRPDQGPLEARLTDPEGNPRAFPGGAGRRRIEWADTWRVGFYRIEVGSGAGKPDGAAPTSGVGMPPPAPPALEYFGVNRDTAESDLTPVDEAAVRRLVPGVAFTWLQHPGVDLADSLRRQRIGTEVAPYLLGLVLLLLLAEGFLARRLSLRGLGGEEAMSRQQQRERDGRARADR